MHSKHRDSLRSRSGLAVAAVVLLPQVSGGLLRPVRELILADSSVSEPRGFADVMTRASSSSLYKQGTWKLTNIQAGQKPLGAQEVV